MTTLRHLRRTAAVLAACATLTLSTPAQAGTPAETTEGLATVTEGITPLHKTPFWRASVTANPRLHEYVAHSPSMDRDVPLFVIAPKNTSAPRPILYVLNGGDGGEGRANWVAQTDIVKFFADKNVWVVIPMSGAFSYYTDWEKDAPKLGGPQKWETFLTKELPGPLEATLGASSKRGIIGMSMTGTTTLLYAEHQPGFYDAIGSFSGCAETNRGFPLEYVRLVLELGGYSPTDMWGPIGGNTFEHNDALLNAERLRGTKMYISSGTGLAGRYDLFNNSFTKGRLASVLERTIVGGIIEAGTNKCTHDLKARLDRADIPVDWNLHPTGTHSWGWWQQDLRDSWPTFARAFNMDPGAPAPMAQPTPVTSDDVDEIADAARGISPSPPATVDDRTRDSANVWDERTDIDTARHGG